jgi:hypothetical protein
VLGGYKLESIPQPLYWYRLRDTSHSHNTVGINRACLPRQPSRFKPSFGGQVSSYDAAGVSHLHEDMSPRHPSHVNPLFVDLHCIL